MGRTIYFAKANKGIAISNKSVAILKEYNLCRHYDTKTYPNCQRGVLAVSSFFFVLFLFYRNFLDEIVRSYCTVDLLFVEFLHFFDRATLQVKNSGRELFSRLSLKKIKNEQI